MPQVRLQRFLAQAGVASRRKAEELILAGRVRVNGKVVRELGVKVDPSNDRVAFDNRRVVTQDHCWLLLNKPDATVSTASDPEGRQTVVELVQPQLARVYPVGRLDYHTQGALLLSNDGELANALMHPSSEIPRVYHVKLKDFVSPAKLDELREGVTLDTGERVKAEAAMLGTTDKHTWVEVVLKQGLNRQIHRMMDVVDLQVLKLIRVSFAGITVEGLRAGQHRSLTQREINELRTMVKLPGESLRRKKPESSRKGRASKKAPRKAGPGKAGPGKAGPRKAGPRKATPRKTAKKPRRG